MPINLKLKAGCKVPAAEKLFEGYSVSDKVIHANVGVDKIELVMQHFICIHNEPLFFILELPSNADTETEIRDEVVETLHKDVYYIDNCSRDEALIVMFRVGDYLFNDGLSSFGYGCHESGDEIMFGKYNILTLFTSCPENYTDFFAEHDIPRNDELVFAWDTFTSAQPGVSKLYTKKGKTVYDIPEKFKDWGMYLAERREDD